MKTANLVNILIKSLGVYLLYKTSVDFLAIYNPIFFDNSPLTTSVYLFNLIIPIIFAYIFLIKTEQVTKWIVSDEVQDKIDISKPEFIHILVVFLGFVSIIWGLLGCLHIQYSIIENPPMSSYSYNFNIQFGNILLIVFGYFILKKRDKLSTYFTIKMGDENDEDNMLK